MQRHLRATTDSTIYITAEVNLDVHGPTQPLVLLLAGFPALARENTEGTEGTR